MELETLNKLYLELSQVTTAKSKKEIELESRIDLLEEVCKEYQRALYTIEASVGSEMENFIKKIRVDFNEKVYPCPF